MILQAGYDCYLTQAEAVPMSERRFENHVLVSTEDDIKAWREITRTEKEKMQQQAAFIDVDAIDVDALGRVETLLEDISENINNAGLTAAQALEVKRFFPAWEKFVGKPLAVGFRLQYNDVLYEVIQEHTAQEDWKPGTGTESLFKVVQEEHEGTKDDPIPWVHNMVLEEGKYYTDKDVLYLCIRDSVIGLSFDLADLVSGGYVEEVSDEEESNESESENETTIDINN